jgi:hypothetical protein
MKQIEVSAEQLERIRILRQGMKATSWLGIEKKTGIPRRAAKRSYEDWQRKQSVAQLQQVRMQVAAEEFRVHMEDLVLLAEALVNGINVLPSTYDRRDSKAVLEVIWQKELSRESKADVPGGYSNDEGRRERQVLRRNRLMFESLKEHTRDKVRWKVLEDWEKAWNECVEALPTLETESSTLVRNYLNLKQESREEKIVKSTGSQDAVKKMADAVLDAAWYAWTTGKQEKAEEFSIVADPGNIRVIFTPTHSSVGLTFIDMPLANEIEKVCKRAAKNLSMADCGEKMASELGKLTEKAEALEEMLEELRLRPILLQTRCELCPA